jgi:anti-sigma factor RsiW
MLGKRFFEESDYGSAIHNFADAYKLDCTKPELLLNVAHAHELLGNRAEAVRALETYMQRGQNLTPDDKAQLQRRIDNLKAALASQAPVPAPVVTAPQPSQAPQPAASGAPASTLTAPPPPAPAAAGGHTAPPWIVAGVGAAALITGGALYLVGANDVSSATTQCGGSTSSCKAGSAAATQNAINQGNNGDNLEKVGSVVFWVGLAAAGGGVLWHFLEPTGSGSSAPAHALVTPTVGPGYAGGSVVGTF